MVNCLLLAAGLSERFGSPKALAPLNNTTVIEHIQRVLLQTKIADVTIVLGAHSERIKTVLLNHTRVQFVYNKDYKFGQTSSFQCGLRALPENSQGVLLLPVDYPFVQAATIDQIIGLFQQQRPSMVIPSYQGRKGHPPVFHSKMFSDLQKLDLTLGINTVFPKYQKEGAILEVNDPGVTATFNTPEEFERLKAFYPLK